MALLFQKSGKMLLAFAFFTFVGASQMFAQPRPIKFLMPDVTVNCGGRFSVPVTVSGFDTLSAIELHLNYPAADLDSISISNFNRPPINVSPPFGINTPGAIVISWFDPSTEGRSTFDGDTLFVLNFRLKPAAAGMSFINFALPATRTFGVKPATGVEITAMTRNCKVTIADLSPPKITCPLNVTAIAPMGQTSVVINSIPPPVATDSCDANLVIAYTLTGATLGSGTGSVNGTTFNVGNTSVSYTATDDADNVAACAFNVIVTPTAPPAALDTLLLKAATLSTLCADSLVVPITVEAFRGINALSFRVLWDSLQMNISSVGNFNTALPTPVTAGDFNITQKGRVVFIWSDANPNRLDTLPNGAVLFHANFRKINGAGGSTVSFTNQNASGKSPLVNITPKIQNGSVGVTDAILPTLSTRPDTTVQLLGNATSAVVNNLGSIAADNCAVRTLGYTLSGSTTGSGANNASGQIFSIGTTTVRYTAVDLAGNTNTASFRVTVNGSVPLSIFQLNLPTRTANCGDTVTLGVRRKDEAMLILVFAKPYRRVSESIARYRRIAEEDIRPAGVFRIFTAF